jgi:hypothetical protein
LTPSNSRTTNGGMSWKSFFVRRSKTFEPSQVNFDSFMRSRKTSSPKSNSWLPSTARSRPVAFQTAIICRPLKMFDATEGASVSPPRT